MQSRYSVTWWAMIVPPNCASDALLKYKFGSAEGSTNVLAIVCRGSFFGRASRACSAASFAECRAASGSGDGYRLDVCRVVEDREESSSSYIRSFSIIAEEDWNRDCCILLAEVCIVCCRIQHGRVRGESNSPLQLSSRNLFMSKSSRRTSLSILLTKENGKNGTERGC